MKIWMTDGSAAPFSDVTVLPVSHPGTLGGEIPYKGALTVEAVDCSARGSASAFAEDRQFLARVMAAAGVTPDDLREPDAWRRLAPQISKVANDDGIIVEPGTPVDLVVIAETGTVGRGQLTPR